MAVPITTAPALWAPADAEQLRDLLSTPFGRRLALAILDATPSAVLKGGSAKYRLGFIAGYERFVGVFNQLADLEGAVQAAATELPTLRSPMYPDLDSDGDWPADLRESTSVPPPTA